MLFYYVILKIDGSGSIQTRNIVVSFFLTLVRDVLKGFSFQATATRKWKRQSFSKKWANFARRSTSRRRASTATTGPPLYPLPFAFHCLISSFQAQSCGQALIHASPRISSGLRLPRGLSPTSVAQTRRQASRYPFLPFLPFFSPCVPPLSFF